jgi:hypothetical protein
MEVNAQRIASGNPSYIETNFYPDGSVRVLLTDKESDPLLILDEKRMDKYFFRDVKMTNSQNSERVGMQSRLLCLLQNLIFGKKSTKQCIS